MQLLLISIAIITIAKGMSWLIAREKPRPELAEYGIALPAAAISAGGRRQIRSDGLRKKDEIAPHQKTANSR